MKGWTKVAGAGLAVVVVGVGASAPLLTVDTPQAAVAGYAKSVADSSGGQVTLASARLTDQARGRAIYELRWQRPDRDLVLITVVQRRGVLGGLLSSWQVVDDGSARAAAAP